MAMPTVLIEVRKQYTREQEAGIIDAVHAALVSGFKIKPGDRDVRLIVHEPHRFACPPACEKPEAFTLIGIDAFAGRSLEAKRNLYRAIVANLEPFGIPKNHVKIMLRELPQENWGIRGGQAACDVDLGFKVDV
jgi:phenylpyruvate tautomerase PptA (4-oxalocrotonate tautomerase family)